MNGQPRTQLARVVALWLALLVGFVLASLTGPALAADSGRTVLPRPTPTPVVACRAAGWSVGDRWGPGPLDVVPDVPLCVTPAAPRPQRPIPALTPPPTDTE